MLLALNKFIQNLGYVVLAGTIDNNWNKTWFPLKHSFHVDWYERKIFRCYIFKKFLYKLKQQTKFLNVNFYVKYTLALCNMCFLL